MAASTQGWSLDFLISKAPHTFRHADRVSAKLPPADLNAKINEYGQRGLPLVIEGFHDLDSWPNEELNLDRFVERSGEDTVSVRNVHTWVDSKVKLTDFITKSRTMGPYVQENEKERWYGKDMECPKPWEEWLRTGNVVPAMLLGNGSHDLFRYRPVLAPVQTLMCYLGIGDTFTPCHKDLCASSGQNLMCYTENNGSSFWFMTASSTAPKASKYFQDLRHELDHENHVVTVEELAKAPFEVYVLEQKLGDLVLVPPRSCHQVVNSGGITLKTSWSRMTLKGLITAYYHEIPIYRRVCRPEIYKVKSTIFHAIIGKTRELESLRSKGVKLSVSSSAGTSRSIRRIPSNSNQDGLIQELANSLKELIPVADAILSEEYDKMGERMPKTYNGTDRFNDESSLTCDFCGGDIFQSFFECAACIEGGINSADRLHLCAGCYVDGRSCACLNLQPQQYGKFQDLIDVREKAVEAVRSYEKQQGRTFTAELKLRDEKLPQLFRAACRLYSNRLPSANQKDRTCTSRQKHVVPFSEALYCKGCHHCKCFTHILESHKVHAAEALLLYPRDKTQKHEIYHGNHLSKSSMFKENLQALEHNQAEGIGHTGYSQMVFNAMNYSHCVPVRHAHYLRPGWYDNHDFMDEEESGSLIEPDRDTHTTTTRASSPLVLDKNRPSLKITLPAMRSNPSNAMTDTSATRASSLFSANDTALDATDIPLTPNSDDSDDIPLIEMLSRRPNPSVLAKENAVEAEENAYLSDDDIPLAPPSPVPSDSESDDVRMVDAFIRPAEGETGTPTPPPEEDEDDEPLVKPQERKRKIPYVLVPRLDENTKMKYVLPRAGKRTPYVLIPPAPYPIENYFPNRQERSGVLQDSSQSQSSERKAGRVQVQSTVSSPEASGSRSEVKVVSPPVPISIPIKKRIVEVYISTKPSSVYTNRTPTTPTKKRKSDALTLNSRTPQKDTSPASKKRKLNDLVPKPKTCLINPTHPPTTPSRKSKHDVLPPNSNSKQSPRRPVGKLFQVNSGLVVRILPRKPELEQVIRPRAFNEVVKEPFPWSSFRKREDIVRKLPPIRKTRKTDSEGESGSGTDGQASVSVSSKPSAEERVEVGLSGQSASPPSLQHAFGEDFLSGVPWRTGRFDFRNFYGNYGTTSYGHRYHDGRPYQNQSQRQPNPIHPYHKHQPNRNRYQQRLGRLGRTPHPFQQPRALMPNVQPQDYLNSGGSPSSGNGETSQSSSSSSSSSPRDLSDLNSGATTSYEDRGQPRVGGPTHKTPPKQPRLHHLYHREGRGQTNSNDRRWQKDKGWGDVRDRQREETEVAPSKNSRQDDVGAPASPHSSSDSATSSSSSETDPGRSDSSPSPRRKTRFGPPLANDINGRQRNGKETEWNAAPSRTSTQINSRTMRQEEEGSGFFRPPPTGPRATRVGNFDYKANTEKEIRGNGRGGRQVDGDTDVDSRTTSTIGLVTPVDQESSSTVIEFGPLLSAGSLSEETSGSDGGGGGHGQDEGSDQCHSEEAQPPTPPATMVVNPEEEEEENTWQNWEDTYVLEDEDDDLFGSSPLSSRVSKTVPPAQNTPLFLRVESDGDDVYEVSLGGEDDFGRGQPSSMDGDMVVC